MAQQPKANKSASKASKVRRFSTYGCKVECGSGRCTAWATHVPCLAEGIPTQQRVSMNHAEASLSYLNLTFSHWMAQYNSNGERPEYQGYQNPHVL